MIPRLRSMVIDDRRMVLVVDRTAGTVSADVVGSYAKTLGLAGALVFDHEIALPDDEPTEGLTIHADELAVLRWAVAELAEVPFSEDPGPRIDALRLLLQRAEQ